MTARKRCPKCGRTRAVSSFYKNSRAADGLGWECKDCAKARVAAWNERHIAEVGVEAHRRHKLAITTRHRVLTNWESERRDGRVVRAATSKLIERHRDEYDRLLKAERRRAKEQV